MIYTQDFRLHKCHIPLSDSSGSKESSEKCYCMYSTKTKEAYIRYLKFFFKLQQNYLNTTFSQNLGIAWKIKNV